MTPRAERWLEMGEDARALADRMRDENSKRIMLDIANSYEELAAWVVRAEMADIDGLD